MIRVFHPLGEPAVFFEGSGEAHVAPASNGGEVGGTTAAELMIEYRAAKTFPELTITKLPPPSREFVDFCNYLAHYSNFVFQPDPLLCVAQDDQPLPVPPEFKSQDAERPESDQAHDDWSI